MILLCSLNVGALLGGLLSASFLFKAVLGAIIWVAIYSIFKQVKDLWMYMKLSLSDTVRIVVDIYLA